MSARVLIIDPDEDQLTSLRFALQEEGYAVEAARDGLEGFERFKESQPNVVITELMMDRLSGFDLCLRIAASDEFRAPVIFYTGFYRDERARKEVVYKYGASGYFVKPFQLQALKRAVARELGQGSVAEMTAPKMPQPRPESRRRFASNRFGEARERNEPPAPGSEEGTEKTSEMVAHSNETSSSPEHLSPSPQSLENPPEDQPVQQSEDWLAELPMFQVASTSARDLSATQPTGTLPAQEEVPQDLVPQPEPLASEVGADEIAAPLFPVLSKSSETPPLYKSRPFQVLTAVVLLGAGFFLFRGPGSILTKKPAVVSEQQPENAQPASQASPSQVVSESTTPTGPGGEPGNPETSSLSSASPQPEAKTLTSDGSASALGISVPRDTPATLQGPPSEGSHATSSNRGTLMISDVTGEGGPPYLLKSKKPIVSPDMARTAGTKSLVVRVVISRQGKVIEAASLNENESNTSLSRAALAAIESWEFSPVRGKDEKVWTRYFSFRFTE